MTAARNAPPDASRTLRAAYQRPGIGRVDVTFAGLEFHAHAWRDSTTARLVAVETLKVAGVERPTLEEFSAEVDRAERIAVAHGSGRTVEEAAGALLAALLARA